MVKPMELKIESGDLVLVQEYGDNSMWMEVVDPGTGTTKVTVTNGHGENFKVSRSDVYGISKDDSVLRA